jgi:hypothetical protein
MRCALYRHFDELGTLLYVGITVAQAARTADHAACAEWVEFAARGSIEWHDSEAAAAVAEAHAIRSERPIFNRAYAVGNPDERIAAYLAPRGQPPSRSPKPRKPSDVRVIRPGEITLTQAAERFAVSRKSLENHQSRHTPGFPQPVEPSRSGCIAFYDAAELEAWIVSHREREGAAT